MMDLLKQASGFFWTAADVVKPLAPLLTRLVIGAAFLQTGVGKWQNLHDVADYFATLGFPAPTLNAALTATIEAVGGAALILGLGTNLFATLLSSTMVVAILTADRMNLVGALTGGDQSLTDIVPLMFLLPLVWLIPFGAGPFSLDYLLRKRFTAMPLPQSRKVPA